MRRVLVPLDGSDLAASILPDARRLAGSGGELVLVRDADDKPPLDVLQMQLKSIPYFEHRFQSRLGVDLGVVLLEDGARHDVQFLGFPVDRERTGDSLHESLVPLEDTQRAGDPAKCQKGGMSSREGSIGIGEALPVGERARSCHTERIIGRAGYRDGVGGLNRREP
jgi:nucleotide-binding universal stress UspA family protein